MSLRTFVAPAIIASSSRSGKYFVFFAGIVAFTVSQIAIQFAQIYMERYFHQSIEPSEWEKTVLGRRADEDYLRIVKYDFFVLGFDTLGSLILFCVGLGLIGKLLLIL
jgi:hypothetical protein